MNIFNELTRKQEQQRLERDLAIAKKMGISLEEYRDIKKKEAEDNIKKAHEEYLKQKGITEEQFQKKKCRKEKWENSPWPAVLGCLLAIIGIVGGFGLLYGLGSLLEDSDFLKTGLLVVAGIMIFGLFVIYICSPVFLIIRGMLEKMQSKNFIKTLIALIITSLLIMGCIYTCGTINKTSDDIYEPNVKMRPDRF